MLDLIGDYKSYVMMQVFQWWKLDRRRIPYPSTLYVTLKGVLPPKDIASGLRSMYAIQQVRVVWSNIPPMFMLVLTCKRSPVKP